MSHATRARVSATLTMLSLIVLLAATGAARPPSKSQRTFLVPATTDPGDCSTDSSLCLSDGRFFVEATWTRPDGSSGAAHAVRLTTDSGYFWFLEPDNVELAVKTLNGCSTNSHSWFFAGGLTNLNVVLTVIDTATGETKTYSNPKGTAFLPIIDTTTFGCPAGAEQLSPGNPEEPSDDNSLPMSVQAHAPAGTYSLGCVGTDTFLCLNGRFQVEADWQTAAGETGSARAFSLTPESGYFWFFDPSNVELVVKTLDACGLEKGNWFFAAGLTTVGVQLRVTDTFTGEVKTYANPLNTAFLPIQDTAAFAFCPTPTPTPSPTLTPTSTTTETTPTLSPTATRAPTVRPTRTRTPGCTYSIVPTFRLFHLNGGSGTVTVAAPTGCAWTALSSVGWITITSGSSGSGNGTVVYQVGPFSCPGAICFRDGAVHVVDGGSGLTCLVRQQYCRRRDCGL